MLEIIITGIVSFITGGGILSLITWKATKKKADVEVKVDEISALHETIESVYKPLVQQQKERIQELDEEVKSLRKQLAKEREDRQKELDLMNNRILAITSALGLRAHNQLRDEKGRFSKPDSTEEETED